MSLTSTQKSRDKIIFPLAWFENVQIFIKIYSNQTEDTSGSKISTVYNKCLKETTVCSLFYTHESERKQGKDSEKSSEEGSLLLLPPLPLPPLLLPFSPTRARPALFHENVSPINPACTIMDSLICNSLLGEKNGVSGSFSHNRRRGLKRGISKVC